MHKKLIMFAFLAIGIGLSFYQVQAAPKATTLQQITGTWKISTTGEDSDSRVNRKMGSTQKWVIKEVDGTVWIGIYHIYKDGSVGGNFVMVTIAKYKDGKLILGTRPTPNNPDLIINTYYDIMFPSSGLTASGQYMEMNSNELGRQLDPLSPEKFAVKHFGIIKMSKVSDSTIPPVSAKSASASAKEKAGWKADKAKNSKIKVGQIFPFIEGDIRDIVFSSLDATVRFIELAIEGGDDRTIKQMAMMQKGETIPMGGPAHGRVIQVIKRVISGKPIILLQIDVIKAKDMPPGTKTIWIGLKG